MENENNEKPYDPYEILEVDRDVSLKEVKRTCKNIIHFYLLPKIDYENETQVNRVNQKIKQLRAGKFLIDKLAREECDREVNRLSHLNQKIKQLRAGKFLIDKLAREECDREKRIQNKLLLPGPDTSSAKTENLELAHEKAFIEKEIIAEETVIKVIEDAVFEMHQIKINPNLLDSESWTPWSSWGQFLASVADNLICYTTEELKDLYGMIDDIQRRKKKLTKKNKERTIELIKRFLKKNNLKRENLDEKCYGYKQVVDRLTESKRVDDFSMEVVRDICDKDHSERKLKDLFFSLGFLWLCIFWVVLIMTIRLIEKMTKKTRDTKRKKRKLSRH